MTATGNQRMLQLAGTLLLGGLLLSAPAGCPGRSAVPDAEAGDHPEAVKIAFDPLVQEILDLKLARLAELVADPEVVAGVRDAGDASSTRETRGARQWDQEWIQAGEHSPLVAERLNSPLALRLIGFREAHPEFVEICVTDAGGFLAAATNKTSDFVQADEAWWQAGSDSRGPLCFEIEYDASSRSEGISMVAPVRDLLSGQMLGVLKAVCRVASVKAEL